eukprot:351161-Chlamydomonas_euryale.AAC.1
MRTDTHDAYFGRWAHSARVRVRVRVAGSRPTRGGPVLSVARQREIKQRVGRCHKGHAIVHGLEPPNTNPTPPNNTGILKFGLLPANPTQQKNSGCGCYKKRWLWSAADAGPVVPLLPCCS